jgi:hypothetical protein
MRLSTFRTGLSKQSIPNHVKYMETEGADIVSGRCRLPSEQRDAAIEKFISSYSKRA